MGNSINGLILHIDLTNSQLTTEAPPDEFYRTYGGGSAMGLYYILKSLPPGTDALAPENVLTFFTGLPTGLAISGQARLSVNARSPLSGAIGDSQSGGFFPVALKGAGFDGIVIRGKSDQPVYLYIEGSKAELRDARHLWGLTTADAETRLKADLGDAKLEILQIGPAGEKQARIASIMSMCNRANGRTGMGAVMGSKLLKAIVVKSTAKVAAADPKAVAALARSGAKDLDSVLDVKGLKINGTADVVAFQNMYGSLPTRNYREAQFEDFADIAGDRMTDTILKDRDTCYACVVRCKRVVETEFHGQAVLPVYGGPEYETIATMGSYCGVHDLKAIALANQLCNAYGLDTIATGATIAFAIECFENGLLTTEDTGGMTLQFGDPDMMVKLVEKIARREGIGDLLAEGSARAAEKIGKNAADYLITFKGTEAPAHMPQAKRTLGLIYSVNPFGADHQSSEHDPMYEEGAAQLYLDRLSHLGLKDLQPAYSFTAEKIRFAYLTEVFYSALDSYCMCQFVWGPSWQLYGPKELADLITAATGWETTVDEMMQVGMRRLNMMRVFNAREGFNREHDVLPKKFLKSLEGSGPSAGVSLDEIELEQAKDEYYRLAGWDVASGVPTPEHLAELGLGWLVM